MSRPDVKTFTRLMAAVPGLRARVTVDSEGWPLVRGTYGRVEWRGVSPVESARIYVYTDRNRICTRLRAVSGVRPCQSGDDEGAVSVLATDHEAILACARLLRTAKSRRGLGLGRPSEAMAALRAKRSTTGPPAAPYQLGRTRPAFVPGAAGQVRRASVRTPRGDVEGPPGETLPCDRIGDKIVAKRSEDDGWVQQFRASRPPRR
jgi:hypothetical protein